MRRLHIALVFSAILLVVAGGVGWKVWNGRTDHTPVNLSASQTTDAIRQHGENLFRNPHDPVRGNPNGDVTLVEFFDYRCTYCKMVHPIVMELLRIDPNIRYVAKEYPVLGPVSVLAAQAALSSQTQGKYGMYNDALMMARNLDENVIFEIAESVGLDPLRLLDDIDAREDDINDAIDGTIELGRKLGLQGTPAFIAGERLILGATSRANLEQLIADARALNAERR